MKKRVFSDGSLAPSYESKYSISDLENFEILEIEEINGWTIAVVRYDGCTAYDGKKLLVYDRSADEVINQKELEPNFSDKESVICPFAMFVPTDCGLSFARFVCENRG